ncbi:MAG: 30S ribosomal protein S7 [Flavobacteriales bacterium]|nr:30S ribosomal protein S7 [Flavobacteriales bacterium]MCX7768048.1 30S ribosomal protein S7 [Flavobacteriales bacterium]MDW8409253.1 30S ribosomal protein S7 [Flavobacteriales bacterium]
MRRAKPKPRPVQPDPIYGDTMVTKFVNNIMREGKKSKAFKIFYSAIEEVAQKTQENGLEVWKKALENVTPQVEVRSRRVGGATYQIPQEIRPARKLSLAMKWLIEAARNRNDKSMSRKLANEILAAYKQEGGAFKKKEDTHRMAEANKAFSHFKFK